MFAGYLNPYFCLVVDLFAGVRMRLTKTCMEASMSSCVPTGKRLSLFTTVFYIGDKLVKIILNVIFLSFFSLFFDDGRADLADLVFDILKPKVSILNSITRLAMQCINFVICLLQPEHINKITVM